MRMEAQGRERRPLMRLVSCRACRDPASVARRARGAALLRDNLPRSCRPLADYAVQRNEPKVRSAPMRGARETRQIHDIASASAAAHRVQVISSTAKDQSLVAASPRRGRPIVAGGGRGGGGHRRGAACLLVWRRSASESTQLPPNQCGGWIRTCGYRTLDGDTHFETFGTRVRAPRCRLCLRERCVLPTELRPAIEDAQRQRSTVITSRGEPQANLLVEESSARQRWCPRSSSTSAPRSRRIGCTGGRHRSISIANQLSQRFRRSTRGRGHREPGLSACCWQAVAAGRRRETVAVFPLQTVLFPARCCRRVFEVRYMTWRRMPQAGPPFAVCPSRRARRSARPALPEPVGCSRASQTATWGVGILQVRSEASSAPHRV